MPQKIKNLTNNFIDFVFNNWLKIAIVVSTLSWLFLFGHVFGINQEISALFNEFWNYISNRKSLTIQTILAIGSTISAIFAVIISVRANRISKIALESERPIIVFDFDGKNFLLSNRGNSDASDLHILVKPQNEDFYIAENNLNITSGIKEMKYSCNFVKNKKYSVVILYQNPITLDIYMLGYNVEYATSGINQLINEDGLLDYQNYLSVYKKLSFENLQKLIGSFVH